MIFQTKCHKRKCVFENLNQSLSIIIPMGINTSTSLNKLNIYLNDKSFWHLLFYMINSEYYSKDKLY